MRLVERIEAAGMRPEVLAAFRRALDEVAGASGVPDIEQALLAGLFDRLVPADVEPAPFDELWPHAELFLTTALLAGLRMGETVRLVPPPLLSLVLALLLVGALTRAGALLPHVFLGGHRTLAENLSGIVVLLTLFVGDKSPDSSGLYAKTDDKARVFLIASWLGTNFEKKPFDFRDRDLLHLKRDDVRTLEIAGPEGAYTLVKKADGEWGVSPDEGMEVKLTPEEYRAWAEARRRRDQISRLNPEAPKPDAAAVSESDAASNTGTDATACSCTDTAAGS